MEIRTRSKRQSQTVVLCSRNFTLSAAQMTSRHIGFILQFTISLKICETGRRETGSRKTGFHLN